MKTKIIQPATLFTLLILILIACNGGHRNTADEKAERKLLSVKDQQKDLEILFNAFKEMHPAYGIYTPADSLQQIYNTLFTTLRQPLSEDEFISQIYPLVSALKCGHTQVRHSAGFKLWPADRQPHLPFQVLVQNGRVFITTHQLESVKTGDEILNINSEPVANIIKHGSDLYAADGNSPTFRELFLSEYDGFEDACNKYYHWKPPYSIDLRTAEGGIKKITADTVALSAPQAEKFTAFDNYSNWSSTDSTGYLPLRFFKDTVTAWFEVHTYQYEDTLLYEKAFNEIQRKGIRNLVIDLRHNTGGDIRIAAKLLTYLADAPFRMVGDLWARIPDPASTRFQPYFDSLKTLSYTQSFKNTGLEKNGHYQVGFQPAFGNLLDKTNLDQHAHFNGKLIVLIDGATFSSGAHTAAAIKQYCHQAVFIGRETAGGSEGCSGGTIQYLTLPNTGIVIEFPLLRVVSVLSNPVAGRGIIPEHIVTYSAMDVVTKKDRDLETALDVLKIKH